MYFYEKMVRYVIALVINGLIDILGEILDQRGDSPQFLIRAPPSPAGRGPGGETFDGLVRPVHGVANPVHGGVQDAVHGIFDDFYGLQHVPLCLILKLREPWGAIQ